MYLFCPPRAVQGKMPWCPHKMLYCLSWNKQKKNKTKNYPPYYWLPSPVTYWTYVNRVKSFHMRYESFKAKPSMTRENQNWDCHIQNPARCVFLRRSFRTLTTRLSRFIEADLSAASPAAVCTLLQTWPQGSSQTSWEWGAHNNHASFWLKLPCMTQEHCDREGKAPVSQGSTHLP